MTNQNGSDYDNCDKYRHQKEYTQLEVFLDNLPYIFMTIIGTVIHIHAFGTSISGFIFSSIYFIYCLFGALWIIIFVCPYCEYFDTRLCPCGYGQIAVKLRKKKLKNKFAEKFKKHIPVIVPLWVIPLIVGTVTLLRNYNSTLLFLLILFIINSYIILPLLARLYGCGHCPQKEDCPWMG